MFVILEVIKEHGPMSSVDLGKLMGITDTSAREHLYNLRDIHEAYIHSWRPALGYGKGRSSQLWAAGDEDDAVQVLKPGTVHTLDDEGYEVHMRNQLRKLAADIQPFRDEMLFRTAGRRP